MKSKITAALLCAAMLATPMVAQAQMRALSDPVVAHPDPESLFTSSDPNLHRNKQAALHIVRELLQCDQWERSGEWLTDKYIQHNPLAASGLAGVKNYFINIAKRQPKENCGKLTNPVVAVQAEGDFVSVQFVRELPVPGRPGETYTTTWFDTWRFVDGKADEHWDPATLPEYRAPAQAMDVNMVLREAKDRAEIEKLMWDYVKAADSLDAAAYVKVFTKDGAFLNVKGPEALHKMIADLRVSQEPRRKAGTLGDMHHIMSNQNIEFVTPDHARVFYYWQTVFGGPAGTKPEPRVAAVGRGVDDVVRVDGKWLIQNRNVSLRF